MAPRHTYRAKGIVYLLSFLLFGVVAVVVVALALGYDVDLKSARLTKTGLLVVNSLPKDAYVTINGQVARERTDTRIKLDPGQYQVKVDRPGVVPWEKDIDLEPGEAALEENILLFARPAERQAQAVGPVSSSHLSPDGRTVYFLATEGGTTALWRTGVDRGASLEKLTNLPAVYGGPTSVAVSADGSRLLVSLPTETAISGPDPGTVTTLPVGGNVRFLPGDSTRLVFERGGSLVSRAADGREETLESGISAWATSASAVYASRPDGTLIRNDPRGNSRREIPAPTPLVDLRPTPGADVLYGRDAGGRLYTLDGDRIVQVAEAVEQYASDWSGDLLAYTSRHELTLWRRATQTSTFVTRASAPYTGLAVVTDGHYLLYQLDGQVHSIAVDGSNDQVLTSAGIGPLLLADQTTLVTVAADGRVGVLERLLPRE